MNNTVTVNKDLDQQIIAVQKEMSGDKNIAESEKYQQINGKISSILDNEIKKIQAKRPNFWVPLIILLIIMGIISAVLHFGRSRFWLVLVISIAILVVEYLGYDFWRRSRVEKNYSELLQIQGKIEKTKGNFNPKYLDLENKRVDLLDKIDEIFDKDGDSNQAYHVLRSKYGDLLVRDIFDKNGFRHYQIVYSLDGKIEQVREFSISRAGYLLTLYEDGNIKKREFHGESGTVLSLKKYDDLYNVTDKIGVIKDQYVGDIAAKVKEIDKIKKNTPTCTYNWFEYKKISDDQAAESLKEAEYIGRMKEGKEENPAEQLDHDLTDKNLEGISTINELYSDYDEEVEKLYSKVEALKQNNYSVYKSLTDLSWFLRPVEVFAGESKKKIWNHLSDILALNAAQAEVVKQLEKSDDVYIINNLILPLGEGVTTKIDHLAITPAGIFIIETKARNIEDGRIYRAKNELDKAAIRKQITLHKDAIYNQLKIASRGFFASNTVEQILNKDAIRSLIVIVNRDNPQKQDFLIDNPNFYREYDRSLIINPSEIGHVIHRNTSGINLDADARKMVAAALEPNARLVDREQLGYDFFPYLNDLKEEEYSGQIWNQLKGIADLQKIISDLSELVEKLIEFEREYQTYESLHAILPYFTDHIPDEEKQLTGKVKDIVDELSQVVHQQNNLLDKTEKTVDEAVVGYSDRIKTLQHIEETNLDAVVPIAVAVVISTLVGTMF